MQSSALESRGVALVYQHVPTMAFKWFPCVSLPAAGTSAPWGLWGVPTEGGLLSAPVHPVQCHVGTERVLESQSSAAFARLVIDSCSLSWAVDVLASTEETWFLCFEVVREARILSFWRQGV